MCTRKRSCVANPSLCGMVSGIEVFEAHFVTWWTGGSSITRSFEAAGLHQARSRYSAHEIACILQAQCSHSRQETRSGVGRC